MEINQATNITKKLFSVNITKKQYRYPMIFTKQLFLTCLGGRKLIFEKVILSGSFLRVPSGAAPANIKPMAVCPCSI